MGETTNKAHVLLTGVTGFVGKVVLEELLRRREELGLGAVSVLIRPEKGQAGRVTTPETRFQKRVRKAGVFRGLPTGWEQSVSVVGGDLEEPRCGLSEEDFAAVTARTTHVIHCAASVDFDLPVKVAAGSNITSALNVLELARACRSLVGMVDVSTAYVTAWRPGPIPETLAHLPRPAEALYQAILDGSRSEAELKAETGHPNTYTYTKCLAEHLLCERRGDVPLTIVRPSIISASWRAPFPGWLDSAAAFAGCLLYAGMGIVKAWVADPGVRLDVVPVDVVSNRIVEAAFQGRMPAPGEPVPIRYAVMGVEKALRVDLSVDTTTRFFRERPGAKAWPGMFVGRQEHGFSREDLLRRGLPMAAMSALLTATKKNQQRRKLEKVDERVRYMNAAFEYFTHHTFDFRPSIPAVLEGYTPQAYLDIVNRSLYQHLLRLDETQMPLAGKAHDDTLGDVEWLRTKPAAPWAIRSLGIALRKTLRQCTATVTFDRPSFERAVAAAPPDTLFVLAPTHRSYFDFLLMSYLCFQHPELGIAVPHIAAAEEFSRIPVVGNLLREARAFYIRRGVGKADPAVGEELRRLVGARASLMFFVEGERSRARRVLAPRRGLLRGLQDTGGAFTVLPIAISYDRVPEEAAFERELGGGARSRMSLPAILKWLARLARGQVRLGRIHMACGEPLLLAPSADVGALSRKLVAEQQRCITTTAFHLRAFLAQTQLEGVDVAWLSAAIRARGGRVLDSALPVPEETSAAFHQSLRNQWMHWFHGDALALFPDALALKLHVERQGWMPPAAKTATEDVRLRRVVEALFAPVAFDYALVARSLGTPDAAVPVHATARAVLETYPSAHLPHLEDAFQALVEREVLVRTESGAHAWGPRAEALKDFLDGCVLESASADELAQRRVAS